MIQATDDRLASFTNLIQRFTERLTRIPDQQQVLRIELWLVDHTRLIANEYSYFDTGRTKYSYQWMDATNKLLYRWDNAHDVPGISTSPHHQHVGSEENVQPSEPMTLEKVLGHIAATLLI